MNSIVLVGFMGSGKTTVGRELANRLQRPFVDLDDEIEAEAGVPISDIFAAEGEAGFREREGRTLQRALQRQRAVIAAGGGAPLAEENWRRIRAGNTVVALMAEPAELARRLDRSDRRPLLQPDARSAISSLLPARLRRYCEADLLLKTDGLAPAALATAIADRLPPDSPHRIAIKIPGAAHEALVGFNLTGLLASAISRLADGAAVHLVADEQVAESHGERLTRALHAAGLQPGFQLVPAGEAAKTQAVLFTIYDALSRARLDRRGVLIALGGGATGDVAGFAAATWMRGIRYVQVPTTLLAMVDSSIGGKTAINLPAGKNMVGAVHQPSAIIADLAHLATQPDADYRASLAEVIKAALIADESFIHWLCENLAALLARDPAAQIEAISRAIAIKAGVVTRDPQELGERAILNYGHTVGHALERALGFGHIRHGEAVAWGMEVAAAIGRRMGSSPEAIRVQHDLLERAGLLESRPVVANQALLDALRHDKKSRDGEPRWVLLREPGRAEHGIDVPRDLVATAIDEVLPQ